MKCLYGKSDCHNAISSMRRSISGIGSSMKMLLCGFYPGLISLLLFRSLRTACGRSDFRTNRTNLSGPVRPGAAPRHGRQGQLTGNRSVPYGQVTNRFHFSGMNDDIVFRALADASRRQLLDRLHRRNGQTLGALCQGLDMTRQAVAKHLAVLEEANLVSWKRQGRKSCTLSILFRSTRSPNAGSANSSSPA